LEFPGRIWQVGAWDADIGFYPRQLDTVQMLRDEVSVIERMQAELGLTKGEAELFVEFLKQKRMKRSSLVKKKTELAGLEARGMVIKSSDNSAYLPVHPRLALSNIFRSWQEDLVRRMRERRLAVDRLTLELIPLYESEGSKPFQRDLKGSEQ
jgi:hypothetical protein